MGGQDGYSRDLLAYNEEANSLLAGIKIRPAKTFDIGLDVAYTAAEGGLDQFDLPAEDYVATHPPTAFDFSQSHTYSDIDVDRLNLDVMLKYKFTADLWLRLWYRFADYSDNEPYLYDTSGRVQWATLSAGWSF